MNQLKQDATSHHHPVIRVRNGESQMDITPHVLVVETRALRLEDGSKLSGGSLENLRQSIGENVRLMVWSNEHPEHFIVTGTVRDTDKRIFKPALHSKNSITSQQ